MKIIKIKSSAVTLLLAGAISVATGVETASANMFTQLVNAANGALPSYGRGTVSSHRSDLNDQRIAKGIREALNTSIDRVAQRIGVELVLNTQVFKTHLPRDLRKVQKALRRSPSSQHLVKNFEEQLIAAVVMAAPVTRDLLKRELSQIEINSPRHLLAAHDTAATEYLHSYPFVRGNLERDLRPAVEQILIRSGAMQSGQEIASAMQLENVLTTRMIDFVIQQSVDGFFLMMEEEERAIRHQPSFRTSDILREVVG